jgi:hypothetical protein
MSIVLSNNPRDFKASDEAGDRSVGVPRQFGMYEYVVVAVPGLPIREVDLHHADPALDDPQRHQTASAKITNSKLSAERFAFPGYRRVRNVAILITWAFVQHSQAQTSVEMENELVRVTVLPVLGGRVLRYIDKATGKNHVWETTRSDTAAGIFDKEGSWPTVNFSGHAFQYEVTRTATHSQIHLWADLGNLRVEKIHLGRRFRSPGPYSLLPQHR